MNEVETVSVANLANAITGDDLEGVVAAVPAELVAPYLAALLDAQTNLRAFQTGLTQRLILDGQTGQSWHIGNKDYILLGAKQSGFRDIPGMLANLSSFGMDDRFIYEAISEIRVTSLRSALVSITNDESRAAAAEIIEEHRIESGTRGTPSFHIVSDYVTGKKEKPIKPIKPISDPRD